MRDTFRDLAFVCCAKSSPAFHWCTGHWAVPSLHTSIPRCCIHLRWFFFYFSQSLERQCSLHLGPGGYMFCNNMFICSICQPKGERAWKDILNQGKTDGNMFCQQFTGKDMRCKSVRVWSDNRWIGNILENSFQDGPSQNFQVGPAQNPQTECMSQSLQENKNVWGYG